MQRASAGGSEVEKQSAEDKPEGRWLVVTTDSVVSFFDYLVPQPNSNRAQFALVRRFDNKLVSCHSRKPCAT